MTERNAVGVLIKQAWPEISYYNTVCFIDKALAYTERTPDRVRHVCYTDCYDTTCSDASTLLLRD